MASQKYSFQKYNKERMARVLGVSLPVSTKHCVEITGRIRRKKLGTAKTMMQNAISKKIPIVFKRHTGDVGHKRGKGIASGRYPVKACREVLKLLDSVEANAQFKGLDTGNMIIVHANAHQASRQMHYGRHTRRLMKRTHVEIVVEESALPKQSRQPEKKTILQKQPDQEKETIQKQPDAKQQDKEQSGAKEQAPKTKTTAPAETKAESKTETKSNIKSETETKTESKPKAGAPEEKKPAEKKPDNPKTDNDGKKGGSDEKKFGREGKENVSKTKMPFGDEAAK